MDPHDSPLAQLQSNEQVQLLEDMNKLRGLGLQRHISLPQLVVCGNTSCGKSSILRALSGVPFPVAGTLCTQFAIELVLRQSLKRHARKSIIPRSDAPSEVEGKLQAFAGDFLVEDVATVIENAKDTMEIRNNKRISDDVLRLEISGPDLPQLTLVDLPGLMQFSSQETDRDLVKRLARKYLLDKSTIILAVVSAKDSLVNQEVLSLAKECDRDLGRTMGIVTKPDLLDDDQQLRDEFLRLASNEYPNFQLSRQWNIVPNPRPEEGTDSFDREAAETELRGQLPWSDLRRDQIGLRALRDSLCARQLEHIVNSLGMVVETIEHEIHRVQQRLNGLGQARTTMDEQKQYLTTISVEYDRLVTAALFGNDRKVKPNRQEATTLAHDIRSLPINFDNNMRQFGHEHQLVARAVSPVRAPAHGSRQPLMVTKPQWLFEVHRIIGDQNLPILPGLFDPYVVDLLFNLESRKWESIAQEYTNEVCRATTKFLRASIRSVCPPESETGDLIIGNIFVPAMAAIQEKLSQKTVELMTPYRENLPFCTTPRLWSNLEYIETHDTKNGFTHTDQDLEGMVAVHRQACMTALHWTRAYYKVAMEGFIDNMVTLGVENCVLQKLPDLFSSTVVTTMSPEMLQLLGGETQEIAVIRTQQEDYLEKLSQALKTCRKHTNGLLAFDKLQTHSPEVAGGTNSMDKPSGSATRPETSQMSSAKIDGSRTPSRQQNRRTPRTPTPASASATAARKSDATDDQTSTDSRSSVRDTVSSSQTLSKSSSGSAASHDSDSKHLSILNSSSRSPSSTSGSKTNGIVQNTIGSTLDIDPSLPEPPRRQQTEEI